MAATNGRSGRPINITITHEADRAARAMLPTHRKLGDLISTLILQEESRREERALMQRQLQAVVQGLESRA